MHSIDATTGDEAYLAALRLVEAHGQLANPRKLPSSAVHDVTFRIADPVQAPPVSVRAGYVAAIGAVEAIQLMAGYSSLDQLDAASAGGFSRFADGGRLRGAYGPRLAGQLPRVEKQLRADQATRQAVAVIWRPDDDLDVKDVPCTVSLTFRVIEDRLSLKVHMRSNDVVLGVPYDWFMFSRTQLAMAEVLGLRVGPYVHHVDDLHVYQADEARAKRCRERGELLEQGGELGAVPQGESVFSNQGSHRFNSWTEVRTNALLVGQGSDSSYRRFRWFYDHVPPLAEGTHVCRVCRYAYHQSDPGATAAWCYDCGVKRTVSA